MRLCIQYGRQQSDSAAVSSRDMSESSERVCEGLCASAKAIAGRESECGPNNYFRVLHLLFGHLCVISENVGDIMPACLAQVGPEPELTGVLGVARLSVLQGTYFVSRSFSPPRSLCCCGACSAALLCTVLVVLRICLLFS